MVPPVLCVDDLSADGALDGMNLDENGVPANPIVFVDLDARHSSADVAARAVADSPVIVVGSAAAPIGKELGPLLESMTCTLVVGGAKMHAPPQVVAVEDLDLGRAALAEAVAHSPRASLTLRRLLKMTLRLSPADGLVAESLAYSMLLSAAEFARWRAATPVRSAGPDAEPAVLLGRENNILSVTLNRPRRHNAFDREVRDGLIEAFDLVLSDRSIERVELRGAGPSFCSGGDLDEFGTSTDVAGAHLIRLDRSVAARIERCRERVHVSVHGACIGAGVEIPSFAFRICADESAYFQLPELAMGLIPGAGGTVGLPRRIGPWRTAYLALSGARVDAATALAWGLIDARVSA